jgi:hypothetical protein
MQVKTYQLLYSTVRKILKTNIIHMILKSQNEVDNYEKTMQSIEGTLNCKKKRKKGLIEARKAYHA